MAKTAAVKSFVAGKKRTQQMLLALQSGEDMDSQLKNDDLFQLQHHHMLACLEKTTVCVFVYTLYDLNIKDLFIYFIYMFF